MNPKRRHLHQPPGRPQPVIYLNGRSYLLAEIGTLANQELNQGNFPAAIRLYTLMLATFPDCAEACYNRGIAQHRLKRFADALAGFDQTLALRPDFAEAHNNRGVALQGLKRFAESLASFDRALALRPGMADVCNNRGVTLQELKRYAEALASYDQAIRLKPDYADALVNRGMALEQVKLYDAALASFDRALALQPNQASLYQKRGAILVNQGNMLEAERMFRQAMALEPDSPEALCSLAALHHYQNLDDPVVKQIQTLLARPDLPPDHREFLNFTLGAIYDDCDRYDEAFECYRLANQIRNATVAYDPEAVRRLTDTTIEVFSRDFFARPGAFASDSRTPLFIVGMPRSGTTLLASILSNHPAIATAGELSAIADLTANLPALTGNVAPYPQAVRRITPDVAARLILAYENRLRRDAGREVPHVIDKHPLNFRYLGFITMLFPQARIIHCTRDPLDTGLSNYFQRFHESYDYSFDLGNTGHFYGQYARLMAHWRNVLPVPPLEISYEEMILDTEPMVRRTLAALGLDWNERCLAPHTNPCVVETASKWQVRQPIHRRSLQRWRHYEKHLLPLRESLRLNPMPEDWEPLVG